MCINVFTEFIAYQRCSVVLETDAPNDVVESGRSRDFWCHQSTNFSASEISVSVMSPSRTTFSVSTPFSNNLPTTHHSCWSCWIIHRPNCKILRKTTDSLWYHKPQYVQTWSVKKDSHSSVTRPSNYNNRRRYTLATQTVACPEVICVRPTVNTVFIDKHCFSSVLMLRSYCLEQSAVICTLRWVSLVLGRSSRLTCSQDIL